MDEKDLIKEAAEDAKAQVINNAEVQKLLRAGKTAFHTFVRGDVSIRYRAGIPHATRMKLMELRDKFNSEKGETADISDEIYRILANLCLDSPWSNPEVWKYVDAETGDVPNILFTMVTKIYETEAQVKSFR